MLGKHANPLDHGNTSHTSPDPETVENPFLSTELEAAVNSAQVDRPTSAKPRSWPIWLTALGLCGVLGGVGSLALWWLATPPPSPDCRQLSALATEMEQLLCAQQRARSGDLPDVLAGLELVSRWTPDHPLYQEAQRSIEEWSKSVLAAAQQRIERSDLRGAIELASRIPAHSPLYQNAQTQIADWQRYWKKGEDLAIAARTAMKAQNWTLAREHIEALRAFSQAYWRTEQVATLSQLLTAEQQGRRILVQAQVVASQTNANPQPGAEMPLAAAIALVSQIDARTDAWADAQPTLKLWSERLLSQAWQAWQRGQLDTANALALPVLKNPALAPTAQDLLWLTQAQKHALASQITLKPTLPQLWNLSAAIATVQLIPATSRYSSTAQSLRQQWQAQLQDLTLLQLAWGTGAMPYPVTKQMAMWQAAQVTRDRPRRAQAQTLVSFWQTELRQLEDQPYLAYARHLAQPGTIAALQQAIAQAQRIHASRPSYPTAQTLITTWTNRIQTIEDQPILDRAWNSANQGDLASAIQIADTIPSGRALYGQAQAAIGGWQASLRAAEQARIRDRQARDRSAQFPQPTDLSPDDSASAQPTPSSSAESFPTPETPNHNPSSLYPPGTEPPPPQIPQVPPPSYLPYEPPPPTHAPPVQPYELPPPPRR